MKLRRFILQVTVPLICALGGCAAVACWLFDSVESWCQSAMDEIESELEEN